MNQNAAPADAGLLVARATEMIKAGRFGAARPIVAALQRLIPGTADAALLAAKIAIQDGRPADARRLLDDAIDAAPENTELRKARAEVLTELGQLPEAAMDAAEAVICDHTDPAAKALLGYALLRLGQAEQAVLCFKDALGGAPKNPAVYPGLAAAEEACSRPEAASLALAAGIAAVPGDVGLRNAAILLQAKQRNFASALSLAEAARRDGVVDACLFCLYAHSLSSLGRHDEAAWAYAEALKLGPEDEYVRHMVAASGVRPNSPRAPAGYVRAVFDGYADRFEAHLISLGYRVPGLIRAGVIDHMPSLVQQHESCSARIGPVLDLGCGTGLVAVACSDLRIGPLVGIDLSARMLACAGNKQLYAELHEADVMDALQSDTREYRLVLAADVLCYFGALEDVLARVYARLAPGGLFLFTVEQLESSAAGWMLRAQGRYAHAQAYVNVASVEAGFQIRELRAESLRQEAGAPVPGWFVVLERPGPEGAK
ncbi:MAG: methyltransferase domain-containing protein [Acetobacteraceae bacterium]|nr:methyltransferase domain-containing protein [Acetobacteraceae bacterium]